jgi:3-oxoacyl-ACP reductase-like protein
MGILGRIFDRIRGESKSSEAPAQEPAPTVIVANNDAAVAPPVAAPAAAPVAAPAPAIERIDMEKQLETMAANNPQKLNWRTSIVDLMKLVGMESTLQERRELADEMGYTGDKSDTAKMNVWLHEKLMARLKE